MGDLKYYVSKYGYGCNYTMAFYLYRLCSLDDQACFDRVKSEYEAACKK